MRAPHVRRHIHIFGYKYGYLCPHIYVIYAQFRYFEALKIEPFVHMRICALSYKPSDEGLFALQFVRHLTILI